MNNPYPPYSGQSAGSSVTALAPAVQRAFDQLEAAIKDASERWSKHNERIQTCLAPTPSVPCQDKVKEPPSNNCAVAERLQSAARQISSLAARIGEITSQVEL